MQKRLYRSSKDEKIAGVCGGIAEYFEIDPTIIRLLWLVSVFVFGTGILLYIIAAIVIPEKREGQTTINLEKDEEGTYKQEDQTDNNNYSQDKERKVMSFALIIIGLFLLGRRFGFLYWLDFRFLFPILLIITGVMLLFNSRK